MSYTSILKIDPGVSVETMEELGNSHGSAPVVWNIFGTKYMGLKDCEYSWHTDDLWPKWKDQNIPLHHRAVLAMTFDMAYVSKQNYSRAAEDIRNFLADFPPVDKYVNHWPAIAKMYEDCPDSPAIALHHMSVGESIITEWDEDLEEYVPIGKDKLFEVYEELEKETK